MILLLFSCPVVSDSLWPRGLQHASLPCPLPSPGACSNSWPLSRWCHPTICRPFLLLPSIFPSIRVSSYKVALPIRWPKYWSFSSSPSNEYSGLISCRIDWFDLLAVQGLSRVFSNTAVQKHQFFSSQLSHPYMITGKTITSTRRTLVGKVMSLLFQYAI